MRKLLIMGLMLGMVYSVSAQVNFGPRVAVISSNLNVKEGVASVKEGDAEFGYQFGAFLRVKVPVIGLYIQPEALLSQTNSTITSGTSNVDLSFNRVDVPVMIGGKIGPLRINAGPAFSFLTKAESDVSGAVVDIKDNYSNTTVGFQAGLGVDVLKFVIDLKYEGALSEKFGETITAGGNSFQTDERSSQIVLAVGFKLF
ncbi:outer membrane beta-barrel protein [Roseivirga echinicomitans]|nr:outer membrane beta-barrel protein [Roseivirga echinicomitans]